MRPPLLAARGGCPWGGATDLIRARSRLYAASGGGNAASRGAKGAGRVLGQHCRVLTDGGAMLDLDQMVEVEAGVDAGVEPDRGSSVASFQPSLVAGGTADGAAVGETEMIAGPRRKPQQDEGDGDKRRRQEEALDEALKNTFPASDPVSVEQPTTTGRARCS